MVANRDHKVWLVNGETFGHLELALNCSWCDFLDSKTPGAGIETQTISDKFLRAGAAWEGKEDLKRSRRISGRIACRSSDLRSHWLTAGFEEKERFEHIIYRVLVVTCHKDLVVHSIRTNRSASQATGGMHWLKNILIPISSQRIIKWFCISST